MNEVVIRGALGCADVLANGAPGQVLTVLADGRPGWAAGAAGGGGVDLCALDGAQLYCLMNALDFTQLENWQLANLAAGLASVGELVTDAFGVSVGYLLPLSNGNSNGM